MAFTDKSNTGYALDRPQEYLSLKTIAKRSQFNIPIDSTDLPVRKLYIDSVINSGFQLLYPLKWFNGAVFGTSDMNDTLILKGFSFVKSMRQIGAPSLFKSSYNKYVDLEITDDGFRETFTQINQLNGFYLQGLGYTGKGIGIAVLDAGFLNADTLAGLQHLWQNSQIAGFKDFSGLSASVFREDWHGMAVLSVMAGNVAGKLTGSAPGARYWLLRTEVTDYEQPIEEYNWCAGAEYADSAGADIINSSLGYSYFDLPFDSYTYRDMDGRTAVTSRAAAMATRKGLIVSTSAGNSGNSAWYYITAPADADSILSVGAIDSQKRYASFSSNGPTYDNRVKPDVMAQGQLVTLLRPDGQPGFSNGTSFSSPLIAGLTACLWQARPMASNIQIIKAIQQSSDRYNNPDGNYGYGIPDFKKALDILDEHTPDKDETVKLLTNISTGEMKLVVFTENRTDVVITVFDLQGRVLKTQNQTVLPFYNEISLDISNYSGGLYFICFEKPGMKPKTFKTLIPPLP